MARVARALAARVALAKAEAATIVAHVRVLITVSTVSSIVGVRALAAAC